MSYVATIMASLKIRHANQSAKRMHRASRSASLTVYLIQVKFERMSGAVACLLLLWRTNTVAPRFNIIIASA